jgi:hypothetical protein
MTTTPQLRPMSIGDMFDAAFRLYRRHFITFVGIVALLQVPMAIVQFVLQFVVARDATLDILRFSERLSSFRGGPLITPNSIPWQSFLVFYAITLGIAVIQGLIVQSLLTGALANAIARSYLGQPVSILSAYRLGWRRYLALVVSSFLLFLIALLILALFMGCSVGGMVAFASTARSQRSALMVGVLGSVVVIVAILLFVPVVLFFFIRFILSTQAIVLEGRGPLSGLGRSWRLIGKSFWRALLVFVLVLVLSLLISGLPTYLASFVAGLVGGARGAENVLRNQAVGALASQLGLIFGLPLLFSIYTLFYYDLRIRKEGYDLELMAQQQAVS